MRTSRGGTARRNAVRLALLAAGLAVVLAACGSDGGDDETTTTTAAPTTTTTAAPTTTTTAPTPTTAAPPASTSTTAAAGLPTDPQAYATAFVDAWSTGDQASALELGTQSAVDTIFAFEGGGTWSLVSCEGAAGSSYCTFNAGGDPTVIVQVGNEAASQGQPHAVTSVQVGP